MTWYGKTLFFIAHCLLHVFGYLLPRLLRFIGSLICCCCRRCETDSDRQKDNYIFRPEKDLKVIHHYDRLEVLENVFGLFDVKQSRREDKQYCVEDYYLEEFENRRAMMHGRRQPWAGLTENRMGTTSLEASARRPNWREALGADERRTASAIEAMLSASAATALPTAEEQQHHQQLRSSLLGIGITDEDLPDYTQMKRDIEEEKKRLAKLKEEKMLTYTSPLYTGHIGTVMGAFRPSEEILYSRERFIAWDGCPLYIDWLYVDGEEPEAFLTATAAADVAQRRAKRERKAKSRGTASSSTTPSSSGTRVGGERAELRNGAATYPTESEDENEASYRRHNPRSRRDGNERHSSHNGRGNDSDANSSSGDGEGSELHEPLPPGGFRAEAPQYSPQEAARRTRVEPTRNATNEPSEASSPPTRRHTITKETHSHNKEPQQQRGRRGFFSGLFSSFTTSSSSQNAEKMQRKSCHDAEGQQPGTKKTGDAPGANNSRTARGVVFILPGLASHSQSNYIQRLIRALHRHHYHCCILNTRGMAPDMEMGEHSNFLFNGGYTRDARDVVQNVLSRENVLRRFFPELFVEEGSSTPVDPASVDYAVGLPVFGIGLSIGGAILSKYLGEEGMSGRDPCLDAAITICPPNDFAKMVEHMNRGTYQKSVYQRDMCGDVKNYILRHKPLQQMPNVDNDWVFSGVNGELLDFRDTVKDRAKAKERARQQRDRQAGRGGSLWNRLGMTSEEARHANEAARAKRERTAEKGTINIENFSRVIHFDEHVIAKNAGYRSIHHYHYDTSAIKWIPYTPIPLLVFSTFDDPVIGRTVLGHRWRETINGNNYLTEHTRAKRMFNAAHQESNRYDSPAHMAGSSSPHPLSRVQQINFSTETLTTNHVDNIRNHSNITSLNFYDRPSPTTTSVAENNISHLTRTKAQEILQNSMQNNKNVVYCESHCGGHMGFLGGPIDELMGREDFMQRFVLQRLGAAADFYFTHVLKTKPDPLAGCGQRGSEEGRGGGNVLDKCSPSVRKTFVEERHLSGIMRRPYASTELRLQHEHRFLKHQQQQRDEALARGEADRAMMRIAAAAETAYPLSLSFSEDDKWHDGREDSPPHRPLSLSPSPPPPPPPPPDPSEESRRERNNESGGGGGRSGRLPARRRSQSGNEHGGGRGVVGGESGEGLPPARPLDPRDGAFAAFAKPLGADDADDGDGDGNPAGRSRADTDTPRESARKSRSGGVKVNRSVPVIISKVPVPPPLWRKSNKCYFTYKTLHNTRKGSDFRTFYDTFFIESDDDEPSSRGSNHQSSQQYGEEDVATTVADTADCEDQEPTVAYGNTNTRVHVEGLVGETLREMQGEGGPAHSTTREDIVDSHEIQVNFREDNVPEDELYEHPNMAAIQRKNLKTGNVTVPMKTDVFDLMSFTRMTVPPSREGEDSTMKASGRSNINAGSGGNSNSSSSEAQRFFQFRGYLLNWMDNTGPYQPVRVNCDYTIDPRMYMREDL